jgi:hypothetical protein
MIDSLIDNNCSLPMKQANNGFDTLRRYGTLLNLCNYNSKNTIEYLVIMLVLPTDMSPTKTTLADLAGNLTVNKKNSSQRILTLT